MGYVNCMNMIKNVFKKFHKDHRGAAIVAVMIAVIFLSVLGTIILYVAGNNAQMKATDYGTKVEFYEAERVLEIMETQLVKDVSSAAMTAYSTVLNEYMSLDQDQRREAYHNAFEAAFIQLLEKNGTTADAKANRLLAGAATQSGYMYSIDGFSVDDAGNTIMDTFYFEQTDHTNAFNVIHKDYIGSAAPTAAPTSTPGEIVDEWHLEIQDVSVVYTNALGYTSIITTDFMIIPPAFGWNSSISYPADTTLKTEVDCMDCVSYINWKKE